MLPTVASLGLLYHMKGRELQYAQLTVCLTFMIHSYQVEALL